MAGSSCDGMAKQAAQAEGIVFDATHEPEPAELMRFYDRQQHATTQSVDKLSRLIAESFCLVTARKDGQLIGLARGVTDGVRGQLVECKLDPSWQGPGCVTHTDGRIEHDSAGIAREMAWQVIEAFGKHGVERVDVIAHETEEDFCRELGFKRAGGLIAMTLDPKTLPPNRAGATGGQAGRP